MSDMARLNVTWRGANGDLPDPVPYDATDQHLKAMATEAIVGGYIPGIPADRGVNLADFVVDRFAATADIPQHRILRISIITKIDVFECYLPLRSENIYCLYSVLDLWLAIQHLLDSICRCLSARHLNKQHTYHN